MKQTFKLNLTQPTMFCSLNIIVAGWRSEVVKRAALRPQSFGFVGSSPTVIIYFFYYALGWVAISLSFQISWCQRVGDKYSNNVSKDVILGVGDKD